jgi:hypothetical protein
MDIDEQSKGNPEWGYDLNFSPVETEVSHHFCGENDIPGALCPNCNKPLLRLLSLDANDKRLNLDPARHPMVHLLYCWTCSIPYGEFTYKIMDSGGVELLKTPPRHDYEFGAKGPYQGFTGKFAGRKVALQPISAEQQEKQIAHHRGDSKIDRHLGPAHQVGGYPKIDNPSKTFCPLCTNEMPLLAAICDDATGNNPNKAVGNDTFTSNCGVQMIFNFCRSCSVVSAYHSCD